MEKIKNFVRTKKIFLALAGIILIALFLRVHNIQYWLRFNDDQVRDAITIDKMVSGEEFPLLGPKAGGTSFKLGPAFYYIEYLSAVTFKNSPIDLAYPIVLFFLLTIPLFFYISQKIFGTPIALILTFLFSISAFAIKYSRFAWNPNMTPFFILLLFIALYQLNRDNLSRKNLWIWSAVAGITIGISVQLHTTLLFILPIFCFLIFFYAFIKKRLSVTSLVLIIFLAVLCNIPSIIYEIQSGGKNFMAFSQGFSEKTTAEMSLGEKIGNSLVCSIQSHTAILSGVLLSDDCDMFSKNNKKADWFWITTIFSIIFFLGGAFLFLKRFFQEENTEKQYLIGIILLYCLLFSLLLIPLGEEISLRFFVAIIFSPFIFLGFWFDFFSKLCQKNKIILFSITTLFLIFSNALTFQKIYLTNDEGKFFGGTRFGDILPIAEYIYSDIKNNPIQSQKYFVFEFGATRSIEYLIEKNGIRDVQYNSSLKELRKKESPIAYIIDNESSGGIKNVSDFPGFEIIARKNLGKYTVIKIARPK